MGLEAKTTAVKGQVSATGRLHVDSKQIAFTSKDLKWSLDLGPAVKTKSTNGQLVVWKGQDKITFDVEKVDRWIDKIMNPPSLLEKLGVKPEMKCWLSSGFSRTFRQQLKDGAASITRKIENCDLAFLFLNDREQFGLMMETCEQLPEKINIWVVYPKGVQQITQGDVMSQMKKIGFGPGKTAAFDDQLSSMRYRRKQ